MTVPVSGCRTVGRGAGGAVSGREAVRVHEGPSGGEEEVLVRAVGAAGAVGAESAKGMGRGVDLGALVSVGNGGTGAEAEA